MGFKPGKQQRRSKGRLHQRAGQFLVMLLEAERQLSNGTLEEREVLANKGVPWEAQKTAAILGISSAGLSHMREALTKNQILHCVAEGWGRGRRISHVRLAGRGLEEAKCFEAHQMSTYAWGRECMRQWSERDDEAASSEPDTQDVHTLQAAIRTLTEG